MYASFRLILQYKGVNNLDAEDIIQDAMIVIGEELKNDKVIINFSAWSHAVLKNKWLDFIKSRKYQKNKTPMELKDVYPAEHDEVDFILMDQLIECFRKVGMVNRRHARILNLHFLGYSTEEICSRLEITKTNMYSLLSRARSMLELCLNKGNLRND
ncbi:MAG: RNA polymerase sigma factor [candidate division Zixibacteria bacterium]|nr:RNA polymerase sigma factor [candidate division Zixibacteria bacterium]